VHKTRFENEVVNNSFGLESGNWLRNNVYNNLNFVASASHMTLLMQWEITFEDQGLLEIVHNHVQLLALVLYVSGIWTMLLELCLFMIISVTSVDNNRYNIILYFSSLFHVTYSIVLHNLPCMILRYLKKFVAWKMVYYDNGTCTVCWLHRDWLNYKQIEGR
jgi:hypothetical protein